MKTALSLFIGLFLFFLNYSFVSAATINVSPGGSISNALNTANPGDTILVQDGTYSGVLTINKGGTSSAWITIKSQNKWGAKIQGTISDGIGIIFGTSGNYIRLQGFDISGFESAIYSNQTASNLYISGNHIHDIGRECTDSAYGLDGMYIHGVSNITLDGNVFNNIGRYAQGENGCNNTTGNYQNHDHAIYVDGGSSVAVTNNIFYNNKSGWDVHVYSSSGLTSTNLNVLNNTFAFANPYRNGHIILAGNLTSSTIANNIFYQPTTSAITVSSATYSNVNITKNLTSVGSITDNTSSGITISGNVTNTDPKFVNAGSFDFHLTGVSPAINAGNTYSSVTTDFDANTRPQGSAYDIGAYEYLGASPTPTPLKPGDANGDNVVDGADYIIWSSHYGGTISGGSSVGDFNGDGKVDGIDYVIWLINYGK